MEIVRRNSKRKVFTWKMETFMKGQKTKKKPFMALGTWPSCGKLRVNVLCVVIDSGTVIHFRTFGKNNPY